MEPVNSGRLRAVQTPADKGATITVVYRQPGSPRDIAWQLGLFQPQVPRSTYWRSAGSIPLPAELYPFPEIFLGRFDPSTTSAIRWWTLSRKVNVFVHCIKIFATFLTTNNSTESWCVNFFSPSTWEISHFTFAIYLVLQQWHATLSANYSSDCSIQARFSSSITAVIEIYDTGSCYSLYGSTYYLFQRGYT